jgi:small subunit ribosomal protein S17
MMVEKKITKKQLLLRGEVVSAKMEKTIVVKVVRTIKHPQFHKILKKSKKYYAHDEKNLAREGDTVEIYEGRPQSKMKRMYLSRVVSSDKAV